MRLPDTLSYSFSFWHLQAGKDSNVPTQTYEYMYRYFDTSVSLVCSDIFCCDNPIVERESRAAVRGANL
jgi:hypothetical protein